MDLRAFFIYLYFKQRKVMYNIKAIQSGLFGLVGFRQNLNPDFDKLTAELLTSRSGLYFNDAHPLITVENIAASIPFDVQQYGEWNEVENYSISDIVAEESKLYEAITLSNNKKPSESADEWQETNALSIYLKQVAKIAAETVLADVFTQKKINYETKSVFEDLQLYEGTGNFNHKIIKNARFVGFDLTLKRMRDISVKINRVGLQLDTANPELQLYLYHSSQPEPIKTITVAATRPGYFQWHNVSEVILNYVNETHNTGGSYILGYYEDDLSGSAIELKNDLNSVPCGGCSAYNLGAWDKWSKYVEIHPFSVSTTELNEERTLWDISQHNYNYATNFGINLSLTTSCDITDFVLRNESIFSAAIRNQVAVLLLQYIAFSTENRGVTERIRQLARYELDNKENNTPGLISKAEKALKALEFDLSDLSSVCLPCVKKTKVRHRSL